MTELENKLIHLGYVSDTLRDGGLNRQHYYKGPISIYLDNTYTIIINYIARSINMKTEPDLQYNIDVFNLLQEDLKEIYNE